ncbi:MAG: type II toxin-antitoxin system RelE/ParE family toxin [Bacteroidales bacterium]|nr:type II toxin-antitoxin system RelE/ParE family toxin [Bacteroidales bacterium]
MPKKIIWSPLSERDFDSILNYLAENWDGIVVQKFISLTFELVRQISINPKQFPLILKSKKIRKCVLTKHNTLFYRETNKTIEVLRIFDNRQDPKKLTFK